MATNHNTRDTVIHVFSGGVAGTAGAILTCPLEVVKTRLQASSNSFFMENVSVPKIASTDRNGGHVTCRTIRNDQRRNFTIYNHRTHLFTFAQSCSPNVHRGTPSMGLIKCIKHIIKNEGPRSLFKGLGPNIVGVAPSRAIYFGTYSQTKKLFNSILAPDTAIVHVISACCAGSSVELGCGHEMKIKLRMRNNDATTALMTSNYFSTKYQFELIF